MIVLAGEILMHLDGEEYTVRAGGIASAPRGIPHAFKVTGADGARLLCLHTPGCCQAFYWDASEPIASDDSRGIDAGPVDMGRVQASAMKNGGIQILGPPPFSHVAHG
jgi:hypothetical protein